MQAPSAERGARPVLVFLLALAVASLPFYLLLNLSGGTGQGMRLYVAGLMWCPALAAFLACRAAGVSFGSLGWAVVSDTSPKEIAGLSGALFNTFGNVAAITTPIAIAA